MIEIKLKIINTILALKLLQSEEYVYLEKNKYRTFNLEKTQLNAIDIYQTPIIYRVGAM